MAEQHWAVSRRRLFTGGAAVAAAATLTRCATAESAGNVTGFGSEMEPFHGPHQSGIGTSPQAHALFVAVDLTPGPREPREALTAVLKLWSADAARLTQGRPALADTEPELAHRPSRLTITVGIGPHVFDRIGLPHRRPESVADLPAFGTDRLDPRWSGGDLLLQICADDAVVVAHTARVLLKNVRTLTAERWRQRGFRTARGADGSGATMRNLMGQLDGTANLREPAELERHVWDDGSRQPWFAGGTVLILRRIRAELDTWDELDRTSKELTVGRRLDTGAPLTGTDEFDEPDLAAAKNGIPIIPPNSHVALARHRSEDERFLRRAYNYDDAPTGTVTEAGLIFASFQRDPLRQFVPVQRRLAESDALNPWITTIGSGVFAILPGATEDGYLGQTLVE